MPLGIDRRVSLDEQASVLPGADPGQAVRLQAIDHARAVFAGIEAAHRCGAVQWFTEAFEQARDQAVAPASVPAARAAGWRKAFRAAMDGAYRRRVARNMPRLMALLGEYFAQLDERDVPRGRLDPASALSDGGKRRLRSHVPGITDALDQGASL
jgi:hypothetical protein